MDIAGLTASIIGILQLAEKTIAISYDYCSSFKNAPQDVRKLLDELSDLTKVLETLQNYANSNPQSEALNKLNEPDGPIHGIASVLEGLCNKLGGKGGLKFIDRLKWPLKEQDMANCIARIERHKTLFMFALTTDQITLSKELEAYAKNAGNTIEEIKSDVRDTTLAIYDLKLVSNDTNEIVRGMKVAAYNTDAAIRGLQSESVAQRLWRKTQITYVEADTRKRVLHWLYPETFDAKHIEISGIRQLGTGEWLLRTPKVQEWVKKNPNSPVLWGYGIPGAGKTFLCSAVIDHLQSQATAANYGLAYIYFDYKEQDQQKPVQVLGSLVKQLLYHLTHLPPHIQELYQRLEPHGKRPTLEELYSALVATLPAFDQVFFVFDALDECNQKKQRTGLLPLFHRMGKSGIHVFVTSRQHPEDIQNSMSGSAHIELCVNGEDIKSYIEQKIDENPRAKRLVKQGRCRDQIISELTDCAKGMFLLVHFHIEYICEMTNVRLIFRALESLRNASNEDRPLDPTYDKAMETVRNQGKGPTKLAMKILAWLVKARRTLTVDELREAVAVEEKRYELDEWDWTDKATLLDVCAGLVTIDEKSKTIRLIHYTVQEYLLGNSIIGDNANFDIAMTCATYLSFNVFSKPARGLYATYNRVVQYPFFHYAGRYLSYHISQCDEDLTIDLLLKILENQGHIASYNQAKDYRTMAEGGGGTGDAHPAQRPLHMACSVGHRGVVQRILDEGADIEAEDGNGERALHLAAFEGHKEMVELLLNNGADISARGMDRFTALHTAAREGHYEVAQVLLDYGADPSAEAGRFGSAPLHFAVVLGHSKVVELLLERGASIASLNNHRSTPLHHAVRAEQPAMVNLFLNRGADIEAVDNDLWRPLHLAASSGRRDFVMQLLDRGADITARDRLDRTPLNIAIGMGRDEIVQLLLDRGSDLFERSQNSRFSLLYKAACAQKVSIVQILLKNGADMSLLREYGDVVLKEDLSLEEEDRLLKVVEEAHKPPTLGWILERMKEDKERRRGKLEEEGGDEGEGEDEDENEHEHEHEDDEHEHEHEDDEDEDEDDEEDVEDEEESEQCEEVEQDQGSPRHQYMLWSDPI